VEEKVQLPRYLFIRVGHPKPGTVRDNLSLIPVYISVFVFYIPLVIGRLVKYGVFIHAANTLVKASRPRPALTPGLSSAAIPTSIGYKRRYGPVFE